MLPGQRIQLEGALGRTRFGEDLGEPQERVDQRQEIVEVCRRPQHRKQIGPCFRLAAPQPARRILLSRA